MIVPAVRVARGRGFGVHEVKPQTAARRVKGVTTEPGGFHDFYIGTHRRLLRVLTAVALDAQDAEDALQEAYVRTSTRWSRISEYDDPEAFTRRVALNLLHDGRKRSRRGRIAAARAAPDEKAPDLEPTTVLVVNALRMLPVEQREAIALYHLLDMPVEQVAAELRRPINTVKTHLSRGRSRLADMLTETRSNK